MKEGGEQRWKTGFDPETGELGAPLQREHAPQDRRRIADAQHPGPQLALNGQRAHVRGGEKIGGGARHEQIVYLLEIEGAAGALPEGEVAS